MFSLFEFILVNLISYAFQYPFIDENDFISIHFSKIPYSFELNVNLPETSKPHTIQFDLQSPINIFYYDILERNTLKTIPKFPETNFIFNNKNYYGYYTYISFNIQKSQMSFQNIPMFLTTKGVYSFKNTLSLSFITNQNSVSFLDYLLINKRIYYRAFSIINLPTTIQSALYFGGTPNEIIKESKYYGKCAIISNNTNWGCTLDGVTVFVNFTVHKTYALFSKETFNDNNNNHNQKEGNSLLVMFNIKDKYFSLPQFMFQKLRDEIFRDVFKNNDCSFGSDGIIFCSPFKANTILSELRFKIDGDEYVLHGNDLFEYYGKMAEFLIMQNEDPEDMSVHLASGFMKRFNISFDYDNEEVTLYSKYSVIYSNIHKTTKRKVLKSIKLYQVIMKLLSIGSLLLLFIKVIEIKQNKKR